MLTNLPYANNTFDLVFSADVLEHIHEDEADAVVRELVRVSRRHLFLSISLKPHTKVGQPGQSVSHSMFTMSHVAACALASLFKVASICR